MRIAHVVENLNMGGAERVVIDLARQQHAHGDDVLLLCLFQPGAMAHEIESLGIPLVACQKQPGMDAAALRRMREALVNFAPTVVHTHNAMPHYYAVLASLTLPVVRINTRHGMGDFLGTFKQRLLYRCAMLFTHMACCVCDAALEHFIDGGLMAAGRAVTVYNGIDIERFHGHAPGALHDLLGLSREVRLLATVGRLNPAKDQACLVNAFARVARSDAQLHLVIIGDGAERQPLEQLVHALGLQSRVHFTGARDDVQRLLPDVSVFVLSSLTEGFSIALLEAGAACLPVVATDVGGTAEIIAPDKRGLLVPARDDAALANAISDLLTTPELSRGLATTLNQWVQENCSQQAMADRYRAVYWRAGA